MPRTLTSWAVIQAFMNINVTLKAKVLHAFGARNAEARFISCIQNSQMKSKAKESRTDKTCINYINELYCFDISKPLFE